MPSMIRWAGRRGEKVVVAVAVLAPAISSPPCPRRKRHLQALGMLMQDAQVELHQVPADDGVGIVLGQPLVETFQQPGTAVAIVERRKSIGRGGIRCWPGRACIPGAGRSLQGDGVEIAAGVGLDVQRHQMQARAIVRSHGFRRWRAGGCRQPSTLASRLTGGDEAPIRRLAAGYRPFLKHLDAVFGVLSPDEARRTKTVTQTLDKVTVCMTHKHPKS